MYARGAIAAIALLVVACRVVPHVNYPIPPGLSASFPPSALSTRDVFTKAFCAVLSERAFDGDGWKACSEYLQMDAVPAHTPPPDLSTDYTLLLVGGFGAECFGPRGIRAFEDAAAHMKQHHGVNWESIPVAAFESSETNADEIRRKVRTLTGQRFIAIAHSKGAVDFMVALQKYSRDLERVEALITVAGAIGGSFLVDDFAALNEKVLRKLSLPCPAPRAADNGIDSMRRKNRQEYLAQVEPQWRAYSISAVSEEANTSKVLMPLWKRLRPYAREHDSHILEREAVVPGGTFLGRAKGDHWAVAMPFYGKVSEDALKVINHNKFPRPALIEAAVRVVIADLHAHP